jgi:dipeptidyl aminopeptidase/acylaminoacyl peptidase
LPEKTIYAPINPPKDNVKMPVIVWAEGGCFKTGTFYQPYLTEIASHGYLILANGPPVGGPPKTVADFGKLMNLGQNKISDLQDSINWVMKGNGAKYGNIDTARIAAGGQSCGGTEALSISYHNDQVKLTFLVNSGALNPNSRAWLKELKYPVAYFNGGPKDIAYKNVSSVHLF